MRVRADALVRELAELEALGDVPARMTALKRELVGLRRTLDEAPRQRRALDVLRAPPIEVPCNVPWSSMQGQGAERFCGQCAKRVYDLSAMTDDEAAAILADDAAQCVRYYQRPDGTILTSDCYGGARRRWRGVAAGVAVAGAAVVGVMAVGFFRMGTRMPTDGRVASLMPLAHVVEDRPSGLIDVEGTLVPGTVQREPTARRAR